MNNVKNLAFAIEEMINTKILNKCHEVAKELENGEQNNKSNKKE
jgi:hypothetical protein